MTGLHTQLSPPPTLLRGSRSNEQLNGSSSMDSIASGSDHPNALQRHGSSRSLIRRGGLAPTPPNASDGSSSAAAANGNGAVTANDGGSVPVISLGRGISLGAASMAGNGSDQKFASRSGSPGLTAADPSATAQPPPSPMSRGTRLHPEEFDRAHTLPFPSDASSSDLRASGSRNSIGYPGSHQSGPSMGGSEAAELAFGAAPSDLGDSVLRRGGRAPSLSHSTQMSSRRLTGRTNSVQIPNTDTAGHLAPFGNGHSNRSQAGASISLPPGRRINRMSVDAQSMMTASEYGPSLSASTSGLALPAYGSRSGGVPPSDSGRYTPFLPHAQSQLSIPVLAALEQLRVDMLKQLDARLQVADERRRQAEEQMITYVQRAVTEMRQDTETALESLRAHLNFAHGAAKQNAVHIRQLNDQLASLTGVAAIHYAHADTERPDGYLNACHLLACNAFGKVLT